MVIKKALRKWRHCCHRLRWFYRPSVSADGGKGENFSRTWFGSIHPWFLKTNWLDTPAGETVDVTFPENITREDLAVKASRSYIHEVKAKVQLLTMNIKDIDEEVETLEQ